MTADKTPERSLHRKLAQVMWEAERIPKNGTAPAAMGGFKFVQVGDAADSIRKALAEKSVSMIPTSIELISEAEHQTAGGKAMTTMTVRTTWTLTDGDSGESTVIQSIGSGADMGDKAAPKAQSSAMKYALLMGFLLSTGDDPEQSDTSDRRPRRQQPVERDETNGTDAAEQRTTHRDGLIGKAIAQGIQDFALRQGPDGPVLPFRIKEGRLSQIAVATGPIATALDTYRDEVLNQRVTVWGYYTDETYDKRDKDTDQLVTIAYKVLHVERIKTPAFEMPSQAPAHNADAIAEIMETLPDPPEAPSEPLFVLDEDERAAVAGGLA